MKLNRVLLSFVINGRGGFDYLKEMMKKAELNIIIALFFLVFFVSAISGAESSIEEQAHVKRSDFPPGFLFGASTSAYQVCVFLFVFFFLLLQGLCCLIFLGISCD